MLNLNNLSNYREDNRLEVKKATSGLPQSLWATYSAFANTNGGVILLGVDELDDKSLHAVGVTKPDKLLSDFWNTINNPSKISLNLLLDKHVFMENVDEKTIIVLEIPRADRALKPIYLNNNPLTETYRRNGEGDYRCTKEMVQAMIRDNGNNTQDMLVLSKLPLSVFDYDSLHRYRNRMKVSRPGHVWEELEDIEFLQKLGAIGIAEDDKRHPTSAGLLMFGFENEILQEYPQFFLDYQENFDADVRWTDRIVSSSGEWSGNLYEFFFKVYNKLIQNPKIKIPFKMEDGLHRIDDTPVHKALREALANCFTNADYYGERGVVIRNRTNEIVLENPGGFRVSMKEALSGGVSSPRNAVIMKMFSLLDIGERSGSGIPNIFHVWKQQNWKNPQYTEMFEPDRTILCLSIDTNINYSADIYGLNAEKNYSVKTSGITSRLKSGLNPTRQRILSILERNPNITVADVAKELSLEIKKAENDIRYLKTHGYIIRTGSKRNGKWIVM
ncbi:MAG: putative DNA binding domain-containing protein [Lachnospiraceae bacterium]|nr:putative DNA binding domain-containing protein [Lachnospiraceae bacterium]